jgi:hypothetical protein
MTPAQVRDHQREQIEALGGPKRDGEGKEELLERLTEHQRRMHARESAGWVKVPKKKEQ